MKKAGKPPITFTETLKPGEEKEHTIVFKEARGLLIANIRPQGADIQINGRAFGKSPVKIEDLDTTKAVKVVTKKRGFGSLTKLVSFGESLDQTLDLGSSVIFSGHGDKSSPNPSGTPSAATVTPSMSSIAPLGSDKDGYLIVYSLPYAKILVDGEDTGKVAPIPPEHHLVLKPAKLVITFVSGRQRVNAEVTINAGKEARLERNLAE